jgi:hypothetical protein
MQIKCTCGAYSLTGHILRREYRKVIHAITFKACTASLEFRPKMYAAGTFSGIGMLLPYRVPLFYPRQKSYCEQWSRVHTERRT